jgi:hypothetical protein
MYAGLLHCVDRESADRIHGQLGDGLARGAHTVL